MYITFKNQSDRTFHSNGIQTAAAILRQLIGKRVVSFGGGGKGHAENQRSSFDEWHPHSNGNINISGDINVGRREFALRVFHLSQRPISFEGVPVQLVNCNQEGNSIEELLETSDDKGQEFRACFEGLETGNYRIVIGDPNLTVFGHPRKNS